MSSTALFYFIALKLLFKTKLKLLFIDFLRFRLRPSMQKFRDSHLVNTIFVEISCRVHKDRATVIGLRLVGNSVDERQGRTISV